MARFGSGHSLFQQGRCGTSTSTGDREDRVFEQEIAESSEKRRLIKARGQWPGLNLVTLFFSKVAAGLRPQKEIAKKEIFNRRTLKARRNGGLIKRRCERHGFFCFSRGT